MRSFSWRFAAQILVLVASTQSFLAVASPPINVDLQASFNSAPYIIELLESAAEEKPEVYFPILDRIAQGYFDSSTTDKELYHRFLHLLRDDELITDHESLSTLKFALAIRNSAPRIEAHYQFYKTAVEPSIGGEVCEAWLEVGGKQYCDPTMETKNSDLKDPSVSKTLPFDRVLGEETSSVPVTLYADPSSKFFRKFHEIASKSARSTESSYRTAYRLRYKPSSNALSAPLVMSGYGVELALKRTDYIVIDDRPKDEQKEEETKSTGSSNTHPDNDEIADIAPLSRSEVIGLAMKAAHFAVNSENPLETLLEFTQDFPKHSRSLAYHNVSDEFIEEYQHNREEFLSPGFNVLWINGVQYDQRKVDAFSLLDHLRRERRLINNFKKMGLPPAEAIALLSNKALLDAHTSSDSQRYDWRDSEEGGEVILWLNDIEKDKRYKDWPSDLDSLLQRTFPGQLPAVRKDISTAVLPVDFSKPESALLLVDTIQGIIKRKAPLKWGIVPLGLTPEAKDQARVIYHLHETYGLIAVFDYLQKSKAAKQKILQPDSLIFQSVIEDRSVKEKKTQMEMQEALENKDLRERLDKATTYLKRLGAFSNSAPVFVNGVPIKQDDEWLQHLSQRISIDVQQIQRGVFEGKYNDDELWIPSVFLEGSYSRRNPTIIPATDKEVTLLNLLSLSQDDEQAYGELPIIPASKNSNPAESAQLTVITDFDSAEGLRFASNAISFHEKHENVQVVFIHNPKTDSDRKKSSNIFDIFKVEALRFPESFGELKEALENFAHSEDAEIKIPKSLSKWPELKRLLNSLRLQPGQSSVLLNGRSLGPLPSVSEFGVEDLNMLYEYEEKKRNGPAKKAIEELDLASRIADASAAAQIYSLIAVSQVSEIPEGIFELPPLIRTNMFYDWQEKHTAFAIGDNSTAVIQMVVGLDPASEVAQKWVPILKALSELEGISLKVFMNPKNTLDELPVKRFYRYVLESVPSFNDDGSLAGGAAHFEKIPAKALLTAGMDVPAAWLVTSKQSIHDLDNIKLSTLALGGRVDATYQLEYILIEGHSRDVTTEAPPRGIQLLLSTAKDPQVADTMIMSNLGYFQFKANPGYYHIDLKAGPSKDIFKLDSVGSMGYEAHPGDETTEVALLSFQGTTLYPRLSRKPGMEEEDVLEASSSKASELVQQGTKLVGNLLKKAGLGSANKSESAHADINIFSVASGHLYERMLNIMMVSVMRHTKHTVKFWFIEQFLSPSFKSFVPAMAKEYGFQYEMVTYKWPHWLRAQKEKQREIWGYKILFLDVLFPLDLDKVIFVDADQIVRTDMMDLNNVDLKGAPYGFTPMCDSRTEMEGYRFWKQGYWKNFLRGLPYHISALYVVDLKRFRQLAAGDRLRQQYHQLSADPNSLSNLDQDLPNNMQALIPIHSLDQNWLWCETWCSDESLKDARTIDLCNNPETKEPKLERAKRQVPEWTEYDDEIAELAKRTKDATLLTGSIQEDELKEKDKPAGEDSSSTATSEKARHSDKDEL